MKGENKTLPKSNAKNPAISVPGKIHLTVGFQCIESLRVLQQCNQTVLYQKLKAKWTVRSNAAESLLLLYYLFLYNVISLSLEHKLSWPAEAEEASYSRLTSNILAKLKTRRKYAELNFM